MSRAPKSRFGSMAEKKIEKQVRMDVARFCPYSSNRGGHGVASGANHRMDSVGFINPGSLMDRLSSKGSP